MHTTDRGQIEGRQGRGVSGDVPLHRHTGTLMSTGGPYWVLPLMFLSLPPLCVLNDGYDAGQLGLYWMLLGIGLSSLAWVVAGKVQAVELYGDHFIHRKWGLRRRVAYASVKRAYSELKSASRSYDGQQTATLWTTPRTMHVELASGDELELVEMTEHSLLERRLNDFAESFATRRASCPNSRAPAVSGFWSQITGPKVMGILGLACLGFGGLMIALYLGGQKAPPAPERATLQEVRGRVIVVTARDSAIYKHPNHGLQNGLEGWQVLLEPGGNADPVWLQLGDWAPFGSSRNLDLARVEKLLPKGSLVTAFVHGGPLVWHLERDGQVLVDFDERVAEHERRARLDVWLMVLLPLLGLLMCGRALFAWWHQAAPDEGQRPRASSEGKA